MRRNENEEEKNYKRYTREKKEKEHLMKGGQKLQAK